MYGTVLDGFIAAFAPPRSMPVLTPQLEAARDEVLGEIQRRLVGLGGAWQVESGGLELSFAAADPQKAGQELAETLLERDWPLLWLEAHPWGYGFAARGDAGTLVIGGVFMDSPRNISWLSVCRIHEIAA
jgi:hypothetical protein